MKTHTIPESIVPLIVLNTWSTRLMSHPSTSEKTTRKEWPCQTK